jgi:hypothetical protein
MTPPRILIFSHEHDFHALAVRQKLFSLGAPCSVIEVDGFPSHGGIVSWFSPPELGASILRDADGRAVEVDDFDAAWWRRLPKEMSFPHGSCETLADQSLVSRDTQTSVLGLATTDFSGRWVSDPHSTRLAENKAIQLRVANSLGLRVPRTLISQDPTVARAFCEREDYNVVIKPVRGHKLAPVLTGMATPEILMETSRIRLSPSIYQEYIHGSRHLRINCFGDTCHSYALDTDQLDWRFPLTAEASPVEIDSDLAVLLVAFVRRLGLRMGCLDVKLTPDDEPVFLEINPQGQFLFLDGLCGTDLLGRFAEFLWEEARPA